MATLASALFDRSPARCHTGVGTGRPRPAPPRHRPGSESSTRRAFVFPGQRARADMTPEHRAIIERMRSSAAVVRRAVEATPPGRSGVAQRAGEWSAFETLTSPARCRRRRLRAPDPAAPLRGRSTCLRRFRRGRLSPRQPGPGRGGRAPPGHDRRRARAARAAARDPAGRRLVAPGAPTHVRRHVHRISRLAGGRTRQGARRADRSGDTESLTGRPAVSAQRESAARASPGSRPRPRARPRP